MESKKCTKCGEVKQIECFNKNKGNKDGYDNRCRACKKQHYEENKERILKRNKQWREENRERANEYSKKYYEENKERRKQWCQENKERRKQYREENKERIKQYREENKERRSEYFKQYRKENKERISERKKQYRQENKERIAEYSKQYDQENKERINERHKKRRLTDPLYKLSCNLRSRTASAFRYQSYRKTSKTAEMLGVPYEVAKDHIERQFTKGMTWENQGEWHIDHIIPLASAQTESELIKLCHYTNLQPLWAKDNKSKHANVIDGTQVKLRL